MCFYILFTTTKRLYFENQLSTYLTTKIVSGCRILLYTDTTELNSVEKGEVRL